MQDGMLVAEIMLYSILHQKLLKESYPSDGRECEEFRTWKQRWNHLLGTPPTQSYASALDPNSQVHSPTDLLNASDRLPRSLSDISRPSSWKDRGCTGLYLTPSHR